jgi:ribonuclease HI
MTQIEIYTDGACSGNPGPGGAGAVIISADSRIEISEGYSLTTNNRMELMAVILSLQKVQDNDRIIIYSDSKYIVDTVNKGWLTRWIENGWRLANKKPAKNADLWRQIAQLIDERDLEFRWVEGHAGNRENERSNFLAQNAVNNPNNRDEEFELTFNPLGI